MGKWRLHKLPEAVAAARVWLPRDKTYVDAFIERCGDLSALPWQRCIVLCLYVNSSPVPTCHTHATAKCAQAACLKPGEPYCAFAA